MSIKLLPNLENQERIANALERLNSILEGQSIKSKVYGVSGLGQESPILTRTYDSVGVLLNLSTNGDFIECVASDNAFQEFFNFQETTDIHGNVFLTITPKSFRIDRVSNGEITAFSVKEYEDGDEKLGFQVHSAFKKWITETEYNGVGSIQIAKYMSSALNKTTNAVWEGGINASDVSNVKVSSISGKYFTKSYVNWDEAETIIKNTDGNYSQLNWMYADLLRMLMVVYFARLDVHNMFQIEFPFDASNKRWDPIQKTWITGSTDNIVSHTGFNKVGKTYKIFGFDDLLNGTYIAGKYITSDGAYYSHLFDFDTRYGDGAIKTSMTPIEYYGSDNEYDIITKLGFDVNEPAFKMATALRQCTVDYPEDSMPNIYYASKFNYQAPSVGYRGQILAFQKGNGWLYPESSIFYEMCLHGFLNGWDNDSDYYSAYAGLRLCKPPQ